MWDLMLKFSKLIKLLQHLAFYKLIQLEVFRHTRYETKMKQENKPGGK